MTNSREAGSNSPDTALSPDLLQKIREAEAGYQGFPSFSSWQAPGVDLSLWDAFADNLQVRKAQIEPQALQSAVDIALRAAAVDTGAIEGLYETDRGFTMTIAREGLAWEQAFTDKGPATRDLIAAQLAGLELVIDAVTGRLPITEAWIRSLHETLCAPQQTYPVWTGQGWQEQEFRKGAYKTNPNSPVLRDGSVHPYSPVERVPIEMHRLVEELNSPQFVSAHPVLQASYAHYALVAVHPFADGNGRVARALASLFFYKAASVPLLIFADRRAAYLDSLQAADADHHEPIVRFFLDSGLDAMGLVLESLSHVSQADPEQVVSRLRGLYRGRSGLTHEEIDGLALRLLDAAGAQLREAVGRLGASDIVKAKLERTREERGPRRGFRCVGTREQSRLTFLLESPPPATAQSSTSLRAQIATDPASPVLFRIEERGFERHFDARLEEVHPELGTGVRLRLTMWADGVVASLLSIVEEQARKTRRESGWGTDRA